MKSGKRGVGAMRGGEGDNIYMSKEGGRKVEVIKGKGERGG